MNRRLIPPIAAIAVLILKKIWDIEFASEHAEVIVEVILLGIGGIGAFLDPKKKEIDTSTHE